MKIRKVYIWEWNTYPSALKRTSSDMSEIEKVINKLRRHFKVRDSCYGKSVEFRGTRIGRANLGMSRITVPKTNVSLLMMVHEIAHLVAYQRYISLGHDKKFKRALKMVHAYVAKKHYFDNEINWKFRTSDYIERRKTDWIQYYGKNLMERLDEVSK